ncbi:hypothetical protein [Bacteriovorax sp. DB6_IX]|uniref:hypothetical protein n=1 Tax=Bacteriovorax sp. DB6_IX TaxID=1353530 RepID=UPI000389FC39|nr:hypothetical protein [Bacteriovorax sp. DB6_IX]EQC48107.1 hypothetical protein M901_0504 [Bacteriovorax sp. DB6_IX]
MKARVLTETLKADANNENVAKKATKKWSDSVDCTIFINKIDFIKGGRLLRDFIIWY